MAPEIEINARFAALTDQRNDAMNVAVLQRGEMAMLRDQLRDMTAQRDMALGLLEGLNARTGDGGKDGASEA